MSKNPLLLGWLMDTKDDCFPYYFSKLEFLKMYGKKCNTHKSDCKAAKTEQECNVKRTLRCTYTEGECVRVINNICNYYDENGVIKEEEWGEEQVEYMDDLYKTASSVKFGEFMLGENYGTTIKTTAFQIISNKFNNIDYGSNDNACVSAIKQILTENRDFMKELFDIREKAYNEMANERSEPFRIHSYIKNSELSIYVFELLKKRKVGKFTTIFTHSIEDDNTIFEILTKNGLCFKEEDENNKQSESFNLSKFEKDDFYYTDKNPVSGFIWKLNQVIFGIVRNVSLGIGAIHVAMSKYVFKTISSGMDIISVIACWGIFVVVLAMMLTFGLQLILSKTKTTSYWGFTIDDPVLSPKLKPIIKELENIIKTFTPVICMILPLFKHASVLLILSRQVSNFFIKKENDIVTENMLKLFEYMAYLGILSNFSGNIKDSLLSGDIPTVERILSDLVDGLYYPFTVLSVKLGQQFGCQQPQYQKVKIGKDPTLYQKILNPFASTKSFVSSEYNSPQEYVYLKAYITTFINDPSIAITGLYNILASFADLVYEVILNLTKDKSKEPTANIATDAYNLFSKCINYNFFGSMNLPYGNLKNNVVNINNPTNVVINISPNGVSTETKLNPLLVVGKIVLFGIGIAGAFSSADNIMEYGNKMKDIIFDKKRSSIRSVRFGKEKGSSIKKHEVAKVNMNAGMNAGINASIKPIVNPNIKAEVNPVMNQVMNPNINPINNINVKIIKNKTKRRRRNASNGRRHRRHEKSPSSGWSSSDSSSFDYSNYASYLKK